MAHATPDIRYKRALKSVHNNIHPKLKLFPKAVNSLNKIMNNFNIKLVKACKDECKAAGTKMLNLEIVARTLKKVFPKQMLIHAYAEGQKAVIGYKNGALVYRDRYAEKERKAKEERASAINPYLAGVNAILKDVGENIKSERLLKVEVADYIRNMGRNIAAKIASHSTSDHPVTIQEAKKAIDGMFGAEMAEHANSEGAKMVFLYESGYVALPPETSPEEEAKKKKLKAKRKKRPIEPEEPEKKKRKVVSATARRKVKAKRPVSGRRIAKLSPRRGRKRRAVSGKSGLARKSRRPSASKRQKVEGKISTEKAPDRRIELTAEKAIEAGLKKLMASISGAFEEEAAREATQQLMEVARFMAKDAQSRAKSGKMTRVEVEAAIKNLLPLSMIEHAMSEAAKSLALQHAGQ